MALLSIPTHYYSFQFYLQCYIEHVDSLSSEATIVIQLLALHVYISLPHSDWVCLWSGRLTRGCQELFPRND